MAETWAIVALYADGADAVLLRLSPGSERWWEDGLSFEDNGGDMAWAKGRPPGVYKLTIRPWDHSTEDDADSGMDVIHAECLFDASGDNAVDWHVVAEAVRDAQGNAEDYPVGGKHIEAAFKAHGLIVSHRE